MYQSTKATGFLCPKGGRYIESLLYVYIYKGSSCGREDNEMDLYTTGPGFKTRLVRYFLPSF